MMIIFAADTETLGLKAGTHRVIELSFARVEDDAWDSFKIETFRFTPRPEHLALAHPKALEVNGYYVGHPDWRDCPEVGSPEAAAIWKYVLSRTRGASLFCQNVPFDRAMMWEELQLHKVYPVTVGCGPEDGPWERSFVEVRESSSYLQKKAGLKSASLNPLYESCRSLYDAPELPHQHRSESDVLRALWVWAHAAGLKGDLGVPSEQIKRALHLWISRFKTESTPNLEERDAPVVLSSVVPTIPPAVDQPRSPELETSYETFRRNPLYLPFVHAPAEGHGLNVVGEETHIVALAAEPLKIELEAAPALTQNNNSYAPDQPQDISHLLHVDHKRED